jgi:hypothetical protein
MKIAISNETITVYGWLRRPFRAEAQEVTDVRVIADRAVPNDLWSRLKLSFGGMKSENKLRAIVVVAGDRAVTLDVYHDNQFEAAVRWLSRHGWDLESAISEAIRTPLVRVPVDKHR